MQLYAGQEDNFNLAAERLNKFLRIETNSSQIDRVTKYYGEALELEFDKSENIDYELFISDKIEIPEAGQSYVMMDGSMILTRENSDWKEMKLGRIFNSKDRFALSLTRNWISNSLYVAHLGGHTDFLNKLEPIVDGYDKLSENLVFVNDGAKWIWNWVEESYPSSVQILDYFHAMEYLGNFAKVVFPDNQARSDWIKKQKDLILNDQIDQTNKAIKKMKCKTQIKKAAQKKIVKYYENNKKRMMYKTFIDKGLLIGSGAIESAHRTVIQKRLKQSGQRWTKQGAQNVVNLRVAYMNGEWEKVVKLIDIAA